MEKEKRGRGRPRKEGARRIQIKTMLSDSEALRLKEFSKRSGFSQSDIVRMGVINCINSLKSLYPEADFDMNYVEDESDYDLF